MRILLVNPFGIGDVLFSLPLVRALRSTQREGLLGYLCNRRTADLVASWDELNWHGVFEKDELRMAWRKSRNQGITLLRRVIQSVREQQFDLLIDLSLGWQISLAGLLAGIPKRIGFDFRNRGRFLTARLPIEGFHTQRVSNYYLDLLSLVGIPKPDKIDGQLRVPPHLNEEIDLILQGLGISPERPLVGLVPGGGASWGPFAIYKQWPPERFARVGDSLATRSGAQVILFGDSRELSLCQQVAGAMKTVPQMVIQAPSLLLLAGLLRRCNLVVGNDGGTLHLACAVGIRTVSIFGPVDGSVYGPAPGETAHRVVSKGLACRPCYQGFRFPPCPWDNACLKELAVESVLEAAEDLLSSQ